MGPSLGLQMGPSLGLQKAPSLGLQKAPSLGLQKAPSLGLQLYVDNTYCGHSSIWIGSNVGYLELQRMQ